MRSRLRAFVLSTLLVLSLPFPARAQGFIKDSTLLKLAQSPQAQDGILNCQYSSLLLSYVNEQSDEELREILTKESAHYRKYIEKGGPSKEAIRIQKQVARDFELLALSSDPRAELGKVLKISCEIGIAAGGTLARGAGLGGSIITSAITLPIRFIGKFGIAFFMREGTSERGVSYATATGQAGGAGQLLGIAYQSVRAALFGGSAWLIGPLSAFALDLEAARVCESVNELNPREVRFCSNYRKLKTREFDLSEKAEGMGVAAGEAALQIFDFRSDLELNPRICEFSPKKQYRIARRARDRLSEQLKAAGVIVGEGEQDVSIDVIAPTHRSCVALSIAAGSEAEARRVRLIAGEVVDGVRITVTEKASNGENTNSKNPEPPTTDEELCQVIFDAQVLKEKNREALGQLKKNLIEISLNPSRFASLALAEVETPDSLVERQNVSEIGTGRNIILVLAPTAAQLAEYEELKLNQKAKQKRFEAMRKDLRKLLKAGSYSQCLRQQQRTRFDYQKFEELSKSLQSAEAVQRVIEFQAIQKQLKKAGRRFLVLNDLKLNWEFLEMTDLNQVRQVLSDPNTANVVFISHGQANGKLVDSRFNELSHDALQWVAPSVQSLSFFSCHSGKALETYQLEKRLETQPSFHKLRYVGHVNTAAFLEKDDSAPVMALSRYLESLDRALSQARLGTERVQMYGRNLLKEPAIRESCRIKVEGFTLSEGALSLKLNGSWVGTIYPEDQGSRDFSFPCDWLKAEGENTAFVENQSLIARSSIASSQVIIRLEYLGGHAQTPSQIFTRNDGTIRSVRYRW